MITAWIEQDEILTLLEHAATIPFEVAIAPPAELKPYGRFYASSVECWVWNYEKLRELPDAELYQLYLKYRDNSD